MLKRTHESSVSGGKLSQVRTAPARSQPASVSVHFLFQSMSAGNPFLRAGSGIPPLPHAFPASSSATVAAAAPPLPPPTSTAASSAPGNPFIRSPPSAAPPAVATPGNPFAALIHPPPLASSPLAATPPAAAVPVAAPSSSEVTARSSGSSADARPHASPAAAPELPVTPRTHFAGHGATGAAASPGSTMVATGVAADSRGPVPPALEELGKRLRIALLHSLPLPVAPFVMAGPMRKLGGWSLGLDILKSVKVRYFVLDGPFLRYYSDERAALDVVTRPRSHSSRASYALQGATMEESRNPETGARRILLHFATSRPEWVEPLDDASFVQWQGALERVLATFGAPSVGIARALVVPHSPDNLAPRPRADTAPRPIVGSVAGGGPGALAGAASGMATAGSARLDATGGGASGLDAPGSAVAGSASTGVRAETGPGPTRPAASAATQHVDAGIGPGAGGWGSGGLGVEGRGDGRGSGWAGSSSAVTSTHGGPIGAVGTGGAASGGVPGSNVRGPGAPRLAVSHGDRFEVEVPTSAAVGRAELTRAGTDLANPPPHSLGSAPYTRAVEPLDTAGSANSMHMGTESMGAVWSVSAGGATWSEVTSDDPSGTTAAFPASFSAEAHGEAGGWYPAGR